MNEREFIKYVVAFLYGDGGVYYHGKNARFEATILETNRDYADWRSGILSWLTEVNIYPIHRENRCDILKTSTRTHPIYSKIRDRVYVDNVKHLDPHYLKMFDWETLAILYMDDGCLSKVRYNSRKNGEYLGFTPRVSIATHKYGYEGNLFLKNFFKEKFDLEFNVARAPTRGKLFWQLLLRSKDYRKFEDGVKSFILPSFTYKLVLDEQLHIDVDEEKVRTSGQPEELLRNQ